MIILRPIKREDIDNIYFLATEASIGITTLPKDRECLQKRIEKSLDSFEKEVRSPQNELYLLVAEDLEKQSVIGISGIAATTGEDDLLSFYKQEYYENPSTQPHIKKRVPLLTPVSYIRGPTEACSLFVLPEWRKQSVGTLLSLGRFIFISSFPERFTDTIYAELRGVSTEDKKSPFWEHVGKNFLTCSYAEALDMLQTGRSFIRDFLPKHSLYVDLLPEACREVIGRTHPDTRGAQAILENQGFHITELVDVFDAGPKIQAAKRDVRAIRNSFPAEIVSVKETITESTCRCLISNNRLKYRACITGALIDERGCISLNAYAAHALEVKKHDTIRCYIIPKRG